MKKQNIEVEGGELLIQSKEGHYAVIPAKHRQEVMDMIKDGCNDCINNYIQALPKDSDYAEDGSLLPDWNKVKAVLNPKNWGVDDYSDKGDFGTAYSTARKAGEKEFMWNNKRFNTNYDGTPQQQLKETGITDERLQGKSEIRKRIVNNIVPQGYGHIGSAVKAIITNTPEMPVPDKEVKYLIPTKKESTRYREEAIDPTKGGRILPRDLWDESKGKAHYDALSLTMGFPQKYNSFGVSSYKPSISKENNTIYYKLTNDTTINNILQRALEPGSTYQVGDLIYKTTTLPIGGSKQLEAESAYNPNITESEGSLGTYTVSRGEDDRGEYISYYDINDYSPFGSYMPGKGGGKNAINSPFGKSFEIYDRIYIKDYGDGQKKRMYYTDKELSELDVNKKNFDALALQREFSNRGYKLPESTKEDGSFDGIWGDETKNALIDWQNKMRPKPIVDKATGLDKYSKNQY